MRLESSKQLSNGYYWLQRKNGSRLVASYHEGWWSFMGVLYTFQYDDEERTASRSSDGLRTSE